MLHTLKSRNSLVVILVALIVAFVSAKPFAQANAWVVIPWGILVFLIAFIAKSKKETVILGGLFGFVVSYAYLWFDDTSTYTLARVIFLIFLILVPSLFGLLCGLLASQLGWTARTHFGPKVLGKHK